MKNHRPTLRLGSFELLESRELLAQAGLAQGMSFDMHADQQFTDFHRGPRMELHSRSIEAREGASFGGTRGTRDDGGFRGDFNSRSRGFSDSVSSGAYNSHTIFESTPTIVIIPTAPVLIIVTLPPPISTPQSSNALTSAVRDNPPQSQRASSFNNPPASNLQSSSAATANRSASSSASSVNSLSVFSDLSLKRITGTDSQDATSTETTAQASQDDDQPVRDDQEAQQSIRPETPAAVLQTAEADEDAELIEIDPEELLKRSKRKSARVAATKNIESSPARESSYPLERSSLRAPALQPAEPWLSETQLDEAIAPVNDDLIELLTGEQTRANSTANVTPFASPANLQLEASHGFYHAAELTDAAIPTEAQHPFKAQPAPVAAAALPAREAQ